MTVSNKLFLLYTLTEKKRHEIINTMELSIAQKIVKFDNLFKGYCRGVKRILAGGVVIDGT